MLTAIITGGNRGLGLATAKQLLNENVQVIITARNSKKLEEALAELTSGVGKSLVHGYLCDVSNKESVSLLKSRIETSFSNIDLIINNAGIILNPKSFPETPEEDINTILNTNLFGPYRITKAFVDLLAKSQNPMVINVSSGMGSHGELAPGYTAYRLSKFALNGLTDIMHRELISKGVKVVSVCPGWVHTDMGGPSAPRSPEEGAKSILAPFTAELEGGGFYRDGKPIPW